MKQVMIIGATSDIGKQISIQLAQKGYSLQITGRNLNILKELSISIVTRFSTEVEIIPFDILNYLDHKKFYDTLKVKPDIVICCIGYYKDQQKAIQNFDELHNTLGSNYLGICSIINIISSDFVVRGSGTITVISSVAGDRGRQLNFIYGSSKAGLTAYLSGLRNLLFSKNIHVVTILLGPVYTKMSAGHNLLPFITLSPQIAAEKIIDATFKKKDSVYIHWVWRYIMFIINCIPEFVFKRLPPF
jgi:short-subunit dehydrogenase